MVEIKSCVNFVNEDIVDTSIKVEASGSELLSECYSALEAMVGAIEQHSPFLYLLFLEKLAEDHSWLGSIGKEKEKSND